MKVKKPGCTAGNGLPASVGDDGRVTGSPAAARTPGLGRAALRSLMLNAGMREGVEELSTLHAAAPDLLAACKAVAEMLKVIDGDGTSTLAGVDLLAAIRKAEGV